MLRPEAFLQQAHVTFRNIPYNCQVSGGIEGPLSGGVLGKGRTVWTREQFEIGRYPIMTQAFVEGVGLVSLDPHWLVRADALDPAATKRLRRSV